MCTSKKQLIEFCTETLNNQIDITGLNMKYKKCVCVASVTSDEWIIVSYQNSLQSTESDKIHIHIRL